MLPIEEKCVIDELGTNSCFCYNCTVRNRKHTVCTTCTDPPLNIAMYTLTTKLGKVVVLPPLDIKFVD